MCNITYSHSGKTDSNGGHKDNQNKSGLGSYHYHCGGHPAHLHPNGVCPYASSTSSNKSSTSSSSSSSKSNNTSTESNKATSTKTTNIDVTKIQINENISYIEVGQSKKFTATITPDNATNKNVTWKSSDETIATISSSGEIIAKKPGTVQITATSSNGKTDTTELKIKEKQSIEITTIIDTPSNSENDVTNNDIAMESKENSNTLAGVIAVGLFGGGSYLAYKKYKKSNKKI